MSRQVYIVPPSEGKFADQHDRSTRLALGRLLAELLDGAFGGELDGSGSSAAAAKEPYFLPSETLTLDEARRLEIRSEDDFYGGVVPHRFVATKAVSHPLVSPRASAPDGWRQLGSEAGDAVLKGYTVFSRKDAKAAAEALLRDGPVRLKAVTGVAGKGQRVAAGRAQLMEALDDQDWDAIGATGLALEQDLVEATTYSVGQARVGGLCVSYHGLQKQTDDNDHESTYGGSVLTVVRGGFDELLALDVSQGVRTAIAQAQVFDGAIEHAYPEFFASRRNYDVLQGFDPNGDRRSGVLEQSWRLGGASGAELVALQALKQQPDLDRVKARTVEIFGEAAEIPPGALILFRGEDPKVGPLTKYAVAETGS